MFGQNRTIIIDEISKTFVYHRSSPLLKQRKECWPLSEIVEFEVKKRSLDGDDYYRLIARIKPNREISFGRFSKKSDAQEAQQKLKSMIRPIK